MLRRMPIVLSLYALLVAALTFAEYKQHRSAQSFLKPLAALGFIVIALLASAQDWSFGRWILAGLISCAIGDVLLLSRESPLKFKLGMAAFAIGHVLYTVAFFHHPAFSFSGTKYALAILPVLAGLAYFLWIHNKLPSDFKIPVAIYSVIIVTMVIASFGVPLWMVPLAASLFAISDMFVARDRFVDDAPANALAITPLYFGAQALFALASYCPAENIIRAQAAVAPPKSWEMCMTDQDCTVIEGVCGAPFAANKRHRHCAASHVKHISANIDLDCAYEGPRSDAVTAVCFLNRCRIEEPVVEAISGENQCPKDPNTTLTCSTDSDCTLAKGTRGWPKVVNKKYKMCAEKQGKFLETFTDGPFYGGDYALVNVTCEAKKCSAHDPWEWDQRDKAVREKKQP